jgi:hypothetical protein
VERDDLAELLARRELTRDEARPDAVERRHASGGRTARENVEDLVDAGSFVEYGRFARRTAAGGPATPTTRSSRRSTRARSRSGRGCRASCRGSLSSPGGASPATP